MELPGYEIEKQIGKGGMARVYLATHTGLQRKVAIKVMNRQLDEDDSGFSDRFMREARIVANLTHQNIVTVYDVGSHDGYNYIAMEYLPGGITLDDKIKEGIELQAGLSTMRQIASALGYAHSREPPIVHRDVKPENIMYREDGSAVLTDFGIARASSSVTKMTATGAVIGTPHYMSPEQAQGHEIGAFSDIYSLGVVFYEMLTGEVPYDADSTIAVVFKHITEPVPTLPDEIADYQHILDHMMAKDKAERYANCEEIIADFDELMGSGVDMGATLVNTAPRKRPASATTGTKITPAATAVNPRAGGTRARTTEQPEPTTEPSGSSSNKLLIGTGVAAALIAISAGAFLFTQDSDEPTAQQIAEQQKQADLERQRAAQAKAAEEKRLAEQRKLEQQKAAEARRLAEQKRLAEEQAKAQATAAAKKKAAEEAAAKQAREQRMAKISSLLSRAGSEFARTRLSAANKTYREVLRLDSNNRKAQDGIERVAEKYLELALREAGNNNFDKADTYIKSARSVDPTSDQLFNTQTKVLEMKATYTAQQKLKQQQAAAARDEPKPQPAPVVQAEPEPKPEPVVEKTRRRSFGGF